MASLRDMALYNWDLLPHVNGLEVDLSHEVSIMIHTAVDQKDLETLHDIYMEYKLWEPICCPRAEIYEHFKDAKERGWV